MARRIAEDLSPEWAAEADSGNLTAAAVEVLSSLPKPDQSDLYERKGRGLVSKKQLSDYVVEYAGAKHVSDPRLAKAKRQIAAWLNEPRRNITDHDLRALREIAEMTARFLKR